ADGQFLPGDPADIPGASRRLEAPLSHMVRLGNPQPRAPEPGERGHLAAMAPRGDPGRGDGRRGRRVRRDLARALSRATSRRVSMEAVPERMPLARRPGW